MTDGKARPCFVFLEGGLLFVLDYVCSKLLGFVSSKKCINNVFDNKALNRIGKLISMS